MTTTTQKIAPAEEPSGWHQFWSKEDWWAVWLGLALVILSYVFYLSGSSISWIAVSPGKWSTLAQLGAQFSKNGLKYLALLSAFLVLFTLVAAFIGQKPKAFIPSFIFIFILSAIIYAIGSWDQ